MKIIELLNQSASNELTDDLKEYITSIESIKIFKDKAKVLLQNNINAKGKINTESIGKVLTALILFSIEPNTTLSDIEEATAKFNDLEKESYNNLRVNFITAIKSNYQQNMRRKQKANERQELT